MTRRSQIEIYMDILMVVSKGKKKPTHIMYSSNLCWTRLKKYLKFLKTQNLIEEKIEFGSSVFELTKNGEDILGYYLKIEGTLTKGKNVIYQKYVINN
jgi:predicted transcriptional regulator